MRRKWMKSACATAVAGIGSLYLTGSSSAGPLYTPVVAPSGGEATLLQIFQNAGIGEGENLGGSSGWSATGLNFSGPSGYTATRIADAIDDTGPRTAGSKLFLDGSNAAASGVTDQEWKDGTVHANAEAKFAGYNQVFGTFAANLVAEKIQTTSNLFNPTQLDIQNPFVAGLDFEWGRDSGGDVLTWSSKESGNAPDEVIAIGSEHRADHLITYRISGSGFEGWMLFWDDQQSPSTDRDFNDLAVLVQVVPLPPAALAALPLLGTVVGFGLKRRRSAAL